MVACVIRCCVALWQTGYGNQVWFVCKLRCGDGYTVLGRCSKQQIRLLKWHWFISAVDTGTVCNGNKQFAVNRLYKVQQVEPLLLCENVLEAFGNFAVVLVIKVVVGFVCPSAGYAHPSGAKFARQFDEAWIGCVDWIVPLLKIAHVGPIFDNREFFGAVNLRLGVRLPESTTGNFRHFHVVGNKSFVNFAKWG